MKFGYAIVLVMFILVTVIGLASADRLPRQVPENQVFTVDTIIDANGQVSDSSSMEWVLDDQDLTYQTLERSSADGAPITLTAEQVADLIADGVDLTVDSAGAILEINIPDGMLASAGGGFMRIHFQKVCWIRLSVLSHMMICTIISSVLASTRQPHQQTGERSTTISSRRRRLIMLATWTDELRSNGGKTALNKNINFDSKNQEEGMNNLQVEKVLTYASTEGAHLNGAESWTLDVAGNYAETADSIRCVFAEAESDIFPAFCNVVKAQSELVNINSAQISTKGALRGVAETGDVPAALSYQIAVTPDSNSGSGFADGTVKTKFSGSIMEARSDNEEPSATNTWKDAASVSGGIKNFQKTFNYESGFSY